MRYCALSELLVTRFSEAKWRRHLFRKPNRMPLDSESGSAVLEFILVATPLFIPALLFFMSMQQVANQEMQVENLARQALRAFTTAESVAQGHQRINFVLDRYSEMESSNGKSRSSDKFTYNISCGGQKCLTPGSTVKIELYRAVSAQLGDDNSRKVAASAVGVVDKWRQ